MVLGVEVPMEVLVPIGGAITAGFGWLAKALIDRVKQQNESYRAFLRDQKDSIEKVTAALVKSTQALTTITERLVELRDEVHEFRKAWPNNE